MVYGVDGNCSMQPAGWGWVVGPAGWGTRSRAGSGAAAGAPGEEAAGGGGGVGRGLWGPAAAAGGGGTAMGASCGSAGRERMSDGIGNVAAACSQKDEGVGGNVP